MSVRSKSTAARTVIYDSPASGDLDAPYNDPVGHNDAVYFCSDWGIYTIATMGSKSISHAAVAGYTPAAPGTGFPSGASIGDSASATYVLATHNLGYVPKYMVALNGNILLNGMQVQKLTGRMRSVSAYATTTQLILWDWGNSTDQALPALSLTYDYIVFQEPIADLAKPGFQARAGSVVMGHGKFDSSKRTMRQIAAGDTSPYWISGGPSVGLLAARWCFAFADGSIVDEPGYFGPFQPPTTTRIGPN
jgi:hypothetical protein